MQEKQHQSHPTPGHVYKILPNTSHYQGVPIPVPSSWEFPGLEIDVRDGYVHMSTLQQLNGTLNRFYAGDQDRVVQLLKVDYGRLNVAKVVKWELAGNGDTFPHLYGTLEGEFVRDLKLIGRGEKESWDETFQQLVSEGWLEE